MLWAVEPTSFSNEEVKGLGLTENLIRLSCGLEDLDDLIRDVDQALNTLICKSSAKFIYETSKELTLKSSRDL